MLVTSEWGTPSIIEDGIVGELLLGHKYGHALHFWDLPKRRHVQTVDLGDAYQMPLDLRAEWAVTKVIDIPAEPAAPDALPDLLKPFVAAIGARRCAPGGRRASGTRCCPNSGSPAPVIRQVGSAGRRS